VFCKTTVVPSEARGGLPTKESIVPQFVGRRTELALLWTWFRDTKSGRWLLAGEGGTGKTAIAYEFASQVVSVDPKEYLGVLWLSAKRREFIEGGVRPIDDPDFSCLDELCVKIASFVGETTHETPTPDAVLDLVSSLPILIIADDVDSLSRDDEDAIEFLSFRLPNAGAKVLLTSRRVPFGLGTTSTTVPGLQGQAAEEFIDSRIQMFDLDDNRFSKKRRKEIVDTTGGSPLFIEDLLRLAGILSVDQALKDWKSRRGNDAREYALGKELDQLPEEAQLVLLTCCLDATDGLTVPEISAITGYSQDLVINSAGSVQKLFLLSKPRFIDGAERFAVSPNTRSLVLARFQGSDALRRLQSAYREASNKKVTGIARSEVGRAMRHIFSLERLGQLEKAEAAVKSALQQYPSNADLIGQLGILLSQWKPHPRANEARENFRRASELRCNRERPYSKWAELELGLKEYSSASEAADVGLTLAGRTPKLLFLAGQARSLLGQELRRQVHQDRAATALREARALLKASLEASEANSRERSTYRRALLALAHTERALGRRKQANKLFDRLRSEFPQ